MKTETFYMRNFMKALLPLFFLLLLNAAFAQKISELPAATYMGIGDLMPIVQNGVTKKLPFSGLTGSLHFLQDSLFVKYRCHKVKGASQWYFSGDTIFIDTCHVQSFSTKVPDSLYFAYGCNSGISRWYFSGDTINLDTCYDAGPGGVNELNDLSDVTLTMPDAGDILRLDDESMQWLNVPFPLAPSGVEDGEQGITSSDQVFDFVTSELAADSATIIHWPDTTASAHRIVTKKNLADTASAIRSSLPSAVGYTIIMGCASAIPTSDGTIWYLGVGNYATTSYWNRFYIPVSGTIKKAYVNAYFGSSCSGEEMSVYILLNGSTNTLIQTVTNSNGQKQWSNSSMNIAVSAGDYITIKMVNAVWVTNPSGGTNGAQAIVFIQ